MSNLKFETLAIHSGKTIDENALSIGLPVQRTSAYYFKNAEHAANLFGLKELGNIYTRLGNPTQEILEKRLASLEKGQAALALSSGTAAIYYSVINIAKAGDEIISANNLYGGTFTMFNDILPQFNIKTKFFNQDNPDEIKNLVNEKTRLIFIETIGNPALDFTDIEEVSKIARHYNLPLIVDSTFTTPYLLNPIEHGADIVIHSLTKWIGGHGTGIGGIVVDSGKFNWKDKKFALYNEPDTGYHNLRFAHDLPEPLLPVAFTWRMRLVPLRNLGACISPDNAWIFLQGLETLALRMERHSENAMKVAEFLKSNPKVSWVRYPGLKDDKSYKTASKYLKKGFGGMVVFGIKGGIESGRKFIENLKLFTHCANVGDAKSLAIHPASTTHSQLSDKDKLSGGITDDLIRLSIGIENINDILDDIKQSIDKI
jgi:O-acetylhomoserine (thiol)-lyase